MIKKVVLIMKMNQTNKIWNLKEILINSLKYLLKEKITEKYVLKKSVTNGLIVSFTKDSKNI